jgi:transcriptional regulator with XRE-family HTH domain
MLPRPDEIRRARLLAGLTRHEAANSADLSVQQYSRVENGRSKGSIKGLHRIALALGVPFEDIVDLDAEDTEGDLATGVA